MVGGGVLGHPISHLKRWINKTNCDFMGWCHGAVLKQNSIKIRTQEVPPPPPPFSNQFTIFAVKAHSKSYILTTFALKAQCNTHILMNFAFKGRSNTAKVAKKRFNIPPKNGGGRSCFSKKWVGRGGWGGSLNPIYRGGGTQRQIWG